MNSDLIVSKEYVVKQTDELIELITSFGNMFEENEDKQKVRLVIGTLITAQLLKIFNDLEIEVK